MDPATALADLVADMEHLPDPQERLSALVSWGKAAPDLPDAECSGSLLVPGCISRVHLHGHRMDGVMRYRLAADSAMVRGLAGVTVRLADGATPDAVAACAFDWPALTRLDRQISPTRLNGLAAIAARIRHLAQSV